MTGTTSKAGLGPRRGSQVRHLASIQYLRAVAALSVLAYHVVGEPLVVGAAGVDVFFVISGFVIGLITAGRPVEPLAFAYDRATRILPLYWFFTVLLAATKMLAPDLLPSIPLDAGWLAQSLLLIPATAPGATTAYPMLHQGWTLWYEALFYALAVAAIVLAPSRQARALTIMILGLVLAGMVLDPRGAIASTYTNPLLVEFLAGYWFAIWRANGGRLGKRLGGSLLVAGAVGFGLAGAFAGPVDGWLRILAWGVPATALVIGAVAIEDEGRMPGLPLLGRLGDASYAIYLSHGIAISVVLLALRRIGTPMESAIDQPLHGLLVCVLATVAGLAVHMMVERPMMNGFRRRRSSLFAATAKVRPTVSPQRP